MNKPQIGDKVKMDESYKMHYPSLKKLTQLSYIDPRVNTEGKKIHVEKEGNFCKGNENVSGHYIVYEDSGMPGSYIGVHISSELSEDSGEPMVNVVAMDSSRSTVVNRVAYRMRQSKIVESEVDVVEEGTRKKTTFGKLDIQDIFKLPNDPDNAELFKSSNGKYRQVGVRGLEYKLTPNQEVILIKKNTGIRESKIIEETKIGEFIVGEWGGDWDTSYTKKGQWYVLNEGYGGPMDASDIVGFVQATSKMTERNLREALAKEYRGIEKHTYITLKAVTVGQKNKWIKDQKQKITSINSTIGKAGLKV